MACTSLLKFSVARQQPPESIYISTTSVSLKKLFLPPFDKSSVSPGNINIYALLKFRGISSKQQW